MFTTDNFFLQCLLDNLHELPKLLVEFGDCEVLHDQIFQFCRKAEEAGKLLRFQPPLVLLAITCVWCVVCVCVCG